MPADTVRSIHEESCAMGAVTIVKRRVTYWPPLGEPVLSPRRGSDSDSDYSGSYREEDDDDDDYDVNAYRGPPPPPHQPPTPAKTKRLLTRTALRTKWADLFNDEITSGSSTSAGASEATTGSSKETPESTLVEETPESKLVEEVPKSFRRRQKRR